MLKKLISQEPRKALLCEYQEKELLPDEIRVKVLFAAAKHGTEFVHFRGLDPFINNRFDPSLQLFLPKEESKREAYFMAPGNMWVGEIIAVGSAVFHRKIGERVAGYGSFQSTQTIQESDALTMPDSMTWKQAVCYDPAQFALGGIRDSQMKLGDHVAIFGLGAIGLIAAQMAKLAGASSVIVCDPIAKRREAALKNGADLALNPLEEDAGLAIKRATDNRGADATIETSGSYQALQQAIRGAAYNANIALVGWYHTCTGGLDLGLEAHFNQPNILLSRACSEPSREYPRWGFERICNTCWEMLKTGKIDCESIVDPVVPFDAAAETYMRIESDSGSSVKMGVEFPQ